MNRPESEQDGTANMTQEKKSNPAALLPILVFLVLYLGSGIWFEYIRPREGQMGFYVMSVVVAFGVALTAAFFQNRNRTFDEKIHLCAKGIGDDNITIMLFIFLMAGAFSGIAAEAGGAQSTANMLMSIIPGRFAVPGLFLIACLISMSMGTSVGTISVLVPIASVIAKQAGLNLALCTGTVVGGAMFGDNLSFISDTTIAATKSQGVAMKDKFRTNFRIALPAAVLTLVLLAVISVRSAPAGITDLPFNIALAVPYMIVLALSLMGANVFAVLMIGIVLFAVIGLAAGTLTLSAVLSSTGDGVKGMYETMIVTILVASTGALVEENGGFEAILSFIRRRANGRRGGMAGIAALVGLIDIASANNTVAIVMAAPIARTISREYDIEPRKTASLLDTCSCVMQGIIPYGAQLLIAASLAKISSMQIIPWLFYPYLLFACVAVSILLDRSTKSQSAKQ